MNPTKLCVRIILLLHMALLVVSSNTRADEKVVLQLKWEHEYQFAGYYAALWQDYYRHAGIEVEIRSSATPDKTLLNPVHELMSGRADFAIGGLDILEGIDQGLPLVVLAPIFQKSPGAVFVLAETRLNTPADLAGMTIAIEEGSYITAEVKALLKAEGIDLDSVNFVSEELTLETLISGKADAIVTYGISGQIEAEQAGIEIKTLYPADYGMAFYGDTLYTRREVLEDNPEMVERFVKASLQGWYYALENRAEIANRISNELPRYIYQFDDIHAYNLAFADVIDDYLLFPIVTLGNNSSYRWEKIHQLLRDIGVVESDLDLNALLITKSELESPWQPAFFVGVVAVAIALILIVLTRHNRFAYMLPLAATVIMIALTLLVEQQRIEQIRRDQSLYILEQLGTLKANIEGALNNKIAILSGFSAYISLNPDITEQDFNSYAKEILEQDPLLRNFAVAPDLVNKFVYPMEGNEAVLGMDYRINEQQRAAVMLVVNSGNTVIDGPLQLVQGGRAFVGRSPIFVEDELGNKRFWGLVSAVLDIENLYRRVGLGSKYLNLDIAIRNKTSLGESSPVFYGNKSVFTSQPVTLNLDMNNISWQLAATPAGGWDNISSDIWAIRGIGLLLTIMVAVISIFRFKQLKEKEKVTERLKRNEYMLKNTGKLARIGGWEYNLINNNLHFSAESYYLYGINEFKGASEKDLVLGHFPQDIADKIREIIDTACKEMYTVEIEHVLNPEQATEKWIRIIGQPVIENGVLSFIRGAVQDITESKKTERIIRHQAEFDSLTQLPNRSLFDAQLRQLIAKTLRNNNKFALLFIDLDDFKSINDSLGHSAGDILLKQVAERLKERVRASDIVARLSGDEFTVILEDIKSSNDIDSTADKIIEALEKPYDLDLDKVFCSASVGITVFPDDSRDPQTLLKNADQAMYAAKAAGRNNYQYFTQKMQQESDLRHRLRNDLSKALVSNELEMHYQPIIELKSGTIMKCEALIRWCHPELGYIPPDQFIPIAEAHGLIYEIGDFAVQAACRDMRNVQEETKLKLEVAINKSTREFINHKKTASTWINEFCTIAHSTNVTVEITESLLMADDDQIMWQLTKLKEAGFNIAIDDFGTGFSSLSYLKRFPVDILKIDREFIHDIETNVESRTLVETIVAMAKALNMVVIAEGIENQLQLDMLRKMDCDFAQGYLFSKPLPLKDLINFLNSTSSKSTFSET